MENDAFEPAILAADCRTIAKLLLDQLESAPIEAWSRFSEKGNQGWTLHQVVSHLQHVAQGWHEVTQMLLDGKEVVYEGLNKRTDLPAFVEAGIEARAKLAPAELMRNLQNSLELVAKQAAGLTEDQLMLELYFPAYNRPLTVAETLGSQLATWALYTPPNPAFLLELNRCGRTIHQASCGGSSRDFFTNFAHLLARARRKSYCTRQLSRFWPGGRELVCYACA